MSRRAIATLYSSPVAHQLLTSLSIRTIFLNPEFVMPLTGLADLFHEELTDQGSF